MLDSIMVLTGNLATAFRTEMVDGKEWRVVPGVLLVEGVHTANNGPLYYPAPELEKSAADWENKPLVLNHPTKNGVLVPVDSDPTFYETTGLGEIRKVEWKGKLRNEYWFDMERCDRVDPRIRIKLDNGEVMAVSSGLGHAIDKKTSTFNGTPYTGVVQGIVPDHVAILLDSKGACDISKGCGCGLTGNASRELLPMTANEMSFDRISRQISVLLDARFGYYAYIRDIYSDFFVYTGRDGQLYKLPYTVSGDTVAIGDSDPIKVKWVTEYRTEAGEFVGNCSCTEMKEMSMNKAAQIAAIIASGTFTEGDRAWLEGQPDDKIGRLHKGITANAAPPAPTPPSPAPVPAPNGGGVTGNSTPTLADYRKNLPPEVMEFVDAAVAEGTKKREALIATITANMAGCPAGTLDPAFLAVQKLPVLEVLAASTAPKTVPVPTPAAGPNYTGLGVIPPAQTGNSAPVQPYIPPSLSFGK